MSSNQILIAWLLISILGLSSCFVEVNTDDDFDECRRGNGNSISRILDLDNFTGIELNIPAEVNITEGQSQFVEVIGQDNIIDVLDLDVRSGVWEIETNECLSNHRELIFNITMIQVDRLEINSSGFIRSENLLSGGDLDITINGSGDLDLGVDKERVEVNINGSGDIFLEGSTSDYEIDVLGSGDIESFDLESKECDVTIIGSGDVEINVVDILNVNITGSGDVYYKGQPQVTVSISGSGDLVDAN